MERGRLFEGISDAYYSVRSPIRGDTRRLFQEIRDAYSKRYETLIGVWALIRGDTERLSECGHLFEEICILSDILFEWADR